MRKVTVNTRSVRNTFTIGMGTTMTCTPTVMTVFVTTRTAVYVPVQVCHRAPSSNIFTCTDFFLQICSCWITFFPAGVAYGSCMTCPSGSFSASGVSLQSLFMEWIVVLLLTCIAFQFLLTRHVLKSSFRFKAIVCLRLSDL